MKLLAGRDEIISQVIPLERGLYAIVNEGGDESNAVSVQLVPVSYADAAPSIRPMTPNRMGVLQRHEFALLNIRSTTEIMAAFIGARSAKAATDLRVVSLDRSSRLSAAAAATSGQIAPNRHLVRLIEIDPGCHLLRFPSVLSTEHTRICISLLSPGMTLLVSGQEETAIEMHAGEVATIDAPAGGQVLLTLIAPAFSKVDFAGISIQPLARILHLLRRGRRTPGATAPRPTEETHARGPIRGIRVIWKDRPLGLDLAISVRCEGDKAFTPAVMTSNWARSPQGKPVAGVKISLLGVNRNKWTIYGEVHGSDGSRSKGQGQVVELSSGSSLISHLKLAMSEVNGGRTDLDIETEGHTNLQAKVGTG